MNFRKVDVKKAGRYEAAVIVVICDAGFISIKHHLNNSL